MAEQNKLPIPELFHQTGQVEKKLEQEVSLNDNKSFSSLDCFCFVLAEVWIN